MIITFHLSLRVIHALLSEGKKMMNEMSLEREDTVAKQQTSPTYSIQSRIETQETLVKCENPHHSANPAPQCWSDALVEHEHADSPIQ